MPRPLLIALAAVMIPFCSFGQRTTQSSPLGGTTNLKSTNVCAGSSFEVYYYLTMLDNENEMSVWLVDEYGGHVVIGAIITQESVGTIPVNVPEETPEGTYTFQIVANQDELYSDPIGDPIYVSLPGLSYYSFYYLQVSDLLYYFQNLDYGRSSKNTWTVNGETFASSDTDVDYRFPAPGSYEVCRSYLDACGIPATQCKTIEASCASDPVDFNYAISDKTVTFSAGAFSDMYYSAWTFGDGATGAGLDVEHTYASYGSIEVCYSMATVCGEQFKCKTIALACQQDVVAFTSSAVERAVTFMNTSAAEYTAFSWAFGDGTTSTDKNPSHTYATGGTYSVTLKSTGKCGEQKMTTQQVTVGCTTNVVAGFTVNVSGLDATVINTSTGATQYSWEFGDGESLSQGTTPAHHYTTAGTYEVCLTASNSCDSRSKCNSVTVSNPLSPAVVTANVAEARSEGVKIYPVPAHDVLVMAFDEALSSEAADVKINSLTGMNLFSVSKARGEDRLDIPVSQLAPGVYVYTIDCSTKTIYGKITVQ